MQRLLRRSLHAAALTTALTLGVSIAAPGGYADETPTTNISEAIDDTIATATDLLDTVYKGCVPTITSWDSIWRTPTAYTTANGSLWFHESGGGTPRILCPGTVRLTVLILDETTTSPLVWDTYKNLAQVETSGSAPSLVADLNVPYAGWDAASAPVAGDLPLPRPYGQITVQVKVERKLSTGRYSMLKNGCMEWYYLIQPTLGFGFDDPSREGSSPCATDAKVLAYDTLDNIETG